MTVKVVRGLVNTESSNPATSTQSAAKVTQSSESAKLVANQSVSSEAAITNLRSVRSSSTGEKIKDSKEAKNLAKDVADRIKSDEKSAKEAHNTSSHSAQVAL